ncbi:MAG: class I SAM-dependent methyltransferase [Elusimicrobiota bacterium]|jgi:2-polyprenyl-3-methyl-5-hydroxy-6-metoxy-1,4-benzoquinol methylase
MTAVRAPYFERKAGSYLEASRRGLWGRLRAAEWSAIRESLDLAPGLSVLDAGCGPGYYSLRMREAADMSVSGIDSSRAMMAQYRANGFKGRLDSIETLKTDRRYDRILIAGVLEFTRRPDMALNNMAGLLRKDGLIVCLVPAAGMPGKVYQAIHRLWGCPTFIREPSHYFQMARRSGLEAVKLVKATVISSVFALRKDPR